MIRVAIVDDERLLRSGLQLMIDAAEDLEVVASCSGVDALRLIAESSQVTTRPGHRRRRAATQPGPRGSIRRGCSPATNVPALARKMHDVVSDKISLITVRAWALITRAPTEELRAEAETIRSLSKTTLEELRELVVVFARSLSARDRTHL